MVALQARVEEGQDGSYRMTVDKRYEMLPILRRAAKTLSPFWFLLLALKVSFIGAPRRLSSELTDPVSFMTFGGSALVSVFAWMLAALGSKTERFPAVIAFNVCSILILFMVSVLFQSSQWWPWTYSKCLSQATKITTLCK